MSDDPPPPTPTDPKPALEYRNYSDDRLGPRKNIGSFFLGMVPGIILVTIYGCANYQMPIYPFSPRTVMFMQAPVFGCVAVVAAVVGAAFLRGRRPAIHARRIFPGHRPHLHHRRNLLLRISS